MSHLDKGNEPRTQRPSVTSLWDSCYTWGWACPLMLGGSHSTLFFSKSPATLRRIWSSCLDYQMGRRRRGRGGRGGVMFGKKLTMTLTSPCWGGVAGRWFPMATEWDWPPITPHQNWRTFIYFFYYSTTMGSALKTNMLYEQIPKNYFKGALNSYKSHYSFWVFDKQCCSFV